MDIWEKLELHNTIYINTVLSTLQPLPIVITYRNQRNGSRLILLLLCDLQQLIRINVVKYETMRIYESQIHLSSRASTLEMLAVHYNWNFQSYSVEIIFMLSLPECVWDFQNNALWDTP